MNEIINVHPSGAGLLLACNLSASKEGVLIEEDTQYSRMGRAVHDSLAIMIDGCEPNIPAQCLNHGVDDDKIEDVQITFNTGRARWREIISNWFPDTVTEHKMSCMLTDNIKLVGTADIVCIERNPDGYYEGNIGDWKTGHKEPNAKEQMLAYAYLLRATCDDTDIPIINGVIIWLKGDEGRGSIETFKFKNAELMDFRKRLTGAIENPDPEYRPGDHCMDLYCPRRFSCPANTTQLIQAANVLTELDFTEENLLEKWDQLGEVYLKFGQMEKLREAFMKALRPLLFKMRSLPLPNGKELVMGEQIKKELNPAKALPILLNRLTDSEVATTMKISLPKALDAVAAKVEKGKGEAKAELERELDDVGAINRTPFYKFQQRKQKPAGNNREIEAG